MSGSCDKRTLDARNPSQVLMPLDPDKFAIDPSSTLVDTIKGAYHSTEFHILRPIMENAILTGSQVDDSTSGRTHSHFGAFAPWDDRSQVTKYRATGIKYTPLVARYIPTRDLVRVGGKVTNSGIIIVSRSIPFKFVKEKWICVPEKTSHCELD